MVDKKEEMAAYYAERSDAEDAKVNGPYGIPSSTLIEASRLGYLEVVQTLLCAWADVNKSDNYGGTPLYKASLNGHLEVVQALLAAGANVSRSHNDGRTLLSLALANNHT